MTAEPTVRVMRARGETIGVVLLLHGGKAESREPSSPWHTSVLRLRPFARAIARRIRRDGVAVWSLRYRVRGWNGAEASPVADARWALDRVREQHGDVPVILVGHSMGGRTALQVADDPAVVGIVALAPWLPAGERRPALGSTRLLVVHGTADSWTDPRASEAYVEAARADGVPATFVPMTGHGHFMLRRAGEWKRLTSEFVCLCFNERVTPNR
ncbi:alpha/beta hydrolase [Sporichthya polymorpha]|uniref:alpha/beta hydrolase n=1 Tax=Sporichthya polymorpha TaxID=35751 RepID=UPI0003799258|nr:alpha/beta fold hydrolase [Sporichthya polymorpha]